MTFEAFVEGMPGLQQHAIAMYMLVHKHATKAGEEYKSRDVGMLRMRATEPSLSQSLRAKNERMANALERDPSGRLAALPDLRGWAMQPDGIGRHWVTWWSALYGAYLDMQKAPALVPLMAESQEVEEVS